MPKNRKHRSQETTSRRRGGWISALPWEKTGFSTGPLLSTAAFDLAFPPGLAVAIAFALAFAPRGSLAWAFVAFVAFVAMSIWPCHGSWHKGLHEEPPNMALRESSERLCFESSGMLDPTE